jgi:mannose/cellobiose epimerase-like protein (N-acyl-D-glucosamine 2-epimerase family)
MQLTRASVRAHLVDQLLPLWARHGLDRRAGGCWNRLDGSLAPLPDGFKRLVVHARQVYAFARGVELGAGGWAREAAAHALEFLVRRFRDERHGGWFFTTSDSGEPLDRRKDLYAHAFALFALAEHHGVFGANESLQLARETLEVLRARLRDPRGGFVESAAEDFAPNPGPRLQNPHMHLCEAFLALHAVAPGEGALAEAGALVELLGARWTDPGSGALSEVFDSAWAPAPGEAGAAVEPGHGFEWFALLHRFAELGGAGDAAGLAERLFGFAERHGLDADGGVFDRVDRGGGPVHTTKRLWPQTEHLKARAVRLRLVPDPGRRARLAAALEGCAKRYLDPATGGWREQLSREGRVLSQAQNATSVYHVVAALSEVLRVVAD